MSLDVTGGLGMCGRKKRSREGVATGVTRG